MTKALIYEDDFGILIFCEDRRIFAKNPLGGYSDLGKNLKGLDRLPKTKEQKEKVEQLKRLLKMDYKEAGKTHFNNCKSKGRKGKLYEGEFNENES